MPAQTLSVMSVTGLQSGVGSPATTGPKRSVPFLRLARPKSPHQNRKAVRPTATLHYCLKRILTISLALNLILHPHLHCLVTGGGLTAQNTWAGPKQTRWLFPVHAVARMFQGKFCAGLRQLLATGKLQFHGDCQPLQDSGAFAALLRQVRARRWVVFAKGSVVGPDAVLDYLGRYTHRVAITNSRLRALDPHARTVTFTYKDYADAGRSKALTLTGVEFIRRLRLHLLPRGFTKIRHYGLLGNNRRHRRVPQARTALASSPLRFAPAPTPRPAPPPLTCPHCQGTQVRCIGRVERSGKVSLFARPWLSGLAPAYTDTS